jgi:hypothetical protein
MAIMEARRIWEICAEVLKERQFKNQTQELDIAAAFKRAKKADAAYQNINITRLEARRAYRAQLAKVRLQQGRTTSFNEKIHSGFSNPRFKSPLEEAMCVDQCEKLHRVINEFPINQRTVIHDELGSASRSDAINGSMAKLGKSRASVFRLREQAFELNRVRAESWSFLPVGFGLVYGGF